jgi:transcriptional regulator with XRE-family HTH domain
MAWGRDGVGEGHSQAKLSDREVAQLREMYAMKRWSQRELAALFGVSQPQVNAILKGKARVA